MKTVIICSNQFASNSKHLAKGGNLNQKFLFFWQQFKTISSFLLYNDLAVIYNITNIFMHVKKIHIHTMFT